jgi:hypothetical protein
MTDPETDAPPLPSARGISKQFGGIEVLTDVDLDLMRGKSMRFWARMAQANQPSPKSWPGCIARRVDR